MKKLIFTLVFVMVMGFGFISCTKDIESYTPQQVKEMQYAAAFEQTFGTISPSQTWGFSNPTSGARALTRSANVNGNLWYQTYKRPTNVTEEEIAWAKEEFGKVRNGASHTEHITWENYWVQQVYTGERASVDGNGSNVYPKDAMNKLIAWGYKQKVISWYPYEWEYDVTGEYQHVNNFNNANNTTEYTDDNTHEKFIGTTLMESMKTDVRNEQFGYHNTKDSKDHFEYIVIEHNGSYFIGFDLFAEHPEGQSANKNMDVTRDWIFDDWIVKISPAKLVTDPDEIEDKIKESGRIICEDLGGIGDFDFNDVVFDATIFESGKTVITILAAGGTLPITVAGKDISSIMGYMVNTIKGGKTHDPYTFTAANTYNSLVEIPIVVTNKDNANQLYSYELKAEMGKAPQKIKVPTTFRWCQEYEEHSIDKAYPGFTEWVNGGTFWEGVVNEEHIY